MMSHDFPMADRNHEINRASKSLLEYASPSVWLPTELAGDDDFGFDYQIQVTSDEQVRNAFRLQLKGTEVPSLSADGQTLSVVLGRRTLNLYANTQDEVMLVLAVVKFADSGKPDFAESRVYWQWLGKELERIRGSRYALDQSTQESVTVHLPTTQQLTPLLDVVAYLEGRLRRMRIVEDLDAIVRNSEVFLTSKVDPLEGLLNIVRDRPSFFQSIISADDEETAPEKGTSETLLSEPLALVRAGRTSLAEEAIGRMDRARFEADPKLHATLLSLEGKIALQRRRRLESLQLFEAAYVSHPIERHLLAQEEVRFLEAVDQGDKERIRAIAKELTAVSSDDGFSLLVRVQVALGEYVNAEATVSRISEPKRLVPRLVLLSGQSKWREVEQVATEALTSATLSLQDTAACQLIAARAAWQRALAPAMISPDETELPVTGPPGMDIEAAQSAWALSDACLRGLKELGWPPNIELIVPVAMSSAAATGKQLEALALLREAAAARPEYTDVQKNLELLAISSNHSEVAIEANLRQPVNHELLVRRCCIHFQLDRYGECLEESLKLLTTLQDAVSQTPMALAMGSAAALKLGRSRDRDRLMAALNGNAEWGEFVYFAKFGQESITSPKPMLEALRDGVAAFPDSRLLTANLFLNLPVDDVKSATEVIALSRVMRRFAAPTADEFQKVIAAYFTVENWQDAEAEARSAIARFGNTEKFLSLLAVAVEMQGSTGEAIALLEQALAREGGRSAALRNYLGLSLRLGRTHSARETIERLLAIESDKDERFELLRLNALILVQQGLLDDAYAVAQNVGKEVSQDVETEEGMYLNLHLAVTLNYQSVPEEDAKEFFQRAAAFSAKWPESTLFRQAILPQREHLTSDDVHDMLDTVLGDSRNQMREFLKRERKLHGGELPIPFVARPGFALHYIGDVFTLWDVAKRSKPEDLQYHLICAFVDETPACDKVLRDVPLLDLTALLVLHDLGLYDVLFSLFPRIAVPRSTVGYISQNARGFLVGSIAVTYAEALLAVINENLNHIDQPSSERDAVKVVNAGELLKEYVELANTGRWAVYTDDAFTRALVRKGGQTVNSLHTLDLLRFADDNGKLSEVNVARHLVKLASWNVGITVMPRYFIATLDGALDGEMHLSPTSRLDRFYQHAPFATLARAVWRVDKTPGELIQHMAALLSEMLKNPKTEEDSVAAVWAFWYYRVKFTPSMNQLGWDLLCFSLMMSLQSSPRGTEGRLIRTMLKVVEVAVGADRMSTKEKDEVVRRLGAAVGSLAGRHSVVGEQLQSRIAAVLPVGTQDGDIFGAAYIDGMRESSAQESKNK